MNWEYLYLPLDRTGRQPAVRYFFNIRIAGGLVRDLEGAEYASAALAREEALSIARELNVNRLIGGEPVDWGTVVEIEQDDGLSAGTVGFLEAAGLPYALTNVSSEIPSQQPDVV